MLLASLGAPMRRQTRLVELEQVALQLLRTVKVRVLIIDELHNILSAKENVRRQFLNLIRFLGNELRIPIVGVGTREAYMAIRSDPQLENRFEPMPLPVWEIAKLLTAATLVAIETGEEAINQKTLAQADYKSPNERRQTFECVL
jgi:ATP-dependent Clp protease ATP-binding subunit ClpA